MSFQDAAAAMIADAETFADLNPVAVKPVFPANDPADPETGWAMRNPDRALLFLFL